jgi:hypothetical protein
LRIAPVLQWHPDALLITVIGGELRHSGLRRGQIQFR